MQQQDHTLQEAAVLRQVYEKAVCTQRRPITWKIMPSVAASAYSATPLAALDADDSPNPQTAKRTLLLSPPFLASHPETLNHVLAGFERNVTDLQMLDRLALGLVTLPDAGYDTVVVLDDPDTAGAGQSGLLGREVAGRIFRALRPGGRLKGQSETFARRADSEDRREAVLAGLIVDGQGQIVKPDAETTKPVPLRLGKKLSQAGSTPAASTVTPADTRKRKSDAVDPQLPSGVGFVNGTDGLDDGDDDELIDEDTLLDEEDLARPIIQRESLVTPFSVHG